MLRRQHVSNYSQNNVEAYCTTHVRAIPWLPVYGTIWSLDCSFKHVWYECFEHPYCLTNKGFRRGTAVCVAAFGLVGTGYPIEDTQTLIF